jgi:hypothetical protein
VVVVQVLVSRRPAQPVAVAEVAAEAALSSCSAQQTSKPPSF